MSTIQGRMAGTILYCQKCGKLIPPEEAEAEDFEELEDVGPMCPLCLEKTDPHLRERFDAARSTRLRAVQALKLAHPPLQVYPPPGSEPVQEYKTTPEIRAIREELAAEARGDAPVAPKPAPPPEPPPFVLERTVGEALGETGMQAPLRLPQPTRKVLWALLGFASVCVLFLLAWPFLAGGEKPVVPASADSQPAGPEVAPPVEPAPPSEPAVPVTPRPVAPAPDANAALLQEVETVVTLTGEAPNVASAERAVERLRQLGAAGDARTKAAAQEALARYEAYVDARVRQTAREAAEKAQELAAQGRYGEAVQRVQQAEAALSERSVWAQASGRAKLAALRADLGARKQADLAGRVAAVTELARNGQEAAARLAAEELGRHLEPDFRAAGQEALQKLAQAAADRAAAEGRREESARQAWRTFFASWDTAVRDGQWDRAAELCRPPGDNPLRTGGLDEPAETLERFVAESEAVRALYDAALEVARERAGSEVNLPLRTGRAAGTLAGADGRSLIVKLGGKAETLVPVERLAPEGLSALLKLRKPQTTDKLAPAVWALEFVSRAEAPDQAGAALAGRYRDAGQAVPAHWARRFGLERHDELRREVAEKLQTLRQSLAEDRIEPARAAMAETRAMLDRHPHARLLNDAERALLDEAEKKLGAVKLKVVVFQNGRQPKPEYVGLHVDQINRYYKNAQRTDVDVQTGLKAGSFNDLQRILIRFDGLQEALKGARIKRAVLELYQLPGGKSRAAILGLYPLKKAWTPEAGTWVHADEKRKVPWQRPGASGPDDAGDLAATLIFDGAEGRWRAWDLTIYIRELIAEQTPNHGLLLKVAQDEPNFDLRFYPPTDLGENPDPSLRPRLVVEVEQTAAPE
ncbi:MAG: DNRLRE domain-containing protein [Planctomycetes bacterium]|nr:DNRLRE domain-containing protein [Planctomycetota bacterium]